MKLYFMRHGQTDYNIRRLFQGQIDIPLNETGREQAIQTKRLIASMNVGFDRIYSSPLGRAVETVKIVIGSDGSDIICDPRLMEMDFGVLDGTRFDEPGPEAGTLFTDPERYIPPEGAESFDEMAARVNSFLDEMRGAGENENILIGSHGGTIRCMLVCIGFMKLSEIWEHGIGNCSVYEVELKDGVYRLNRIHATNDYFKGTK